MIRGVELRGAIAINAITMIGIGPLITIPLILQSLHGYGALIAWGAGALVALCDGLVYAELGALYPTSGATYAYLRETFGPARWGGLLGFLFVWQWLFYAILVLASGYIGFANYAAYFVPALGTSWVAQGCVGSTVGIVTIVLLYRAIPAVARIAIALGTVAAGTLAVVTVAGFTHAGAVAQATPHGITDGPFVAGFGAALIVALYDYAGYNAAATLGDEIVAPARTLPRATIAAVVVVAALYTLLNLGVLHAITWQEAAASPYVAATVVERTWGRVAAWLVTAAILLVAFASTYGLLLQSSRIPYAAARDGAFLPAFARLHPRGRFPSVSLLAIGICALPAAFLPLGVVIAALTAGIVLIQGIGQIVALAVLRARGVRSPFRMWAYPLPALVAFAGWLFAFVSSGTNAIVFGLVTLAAGAAVYCVRARMTARWPFAATTLVLAAVFAATAVPAGAQAATPPPDAFRASALQRDHGYTVFAVHGKPYFVWAASFFFERLPRERWRPALRALRAIGVNTIDAYVIWNWHEPADGDFDFTGRTNPRRDLRGFLALCRELGFYVIVRPGPVIRNEWRNAGYPPWLLTRPEYGMPLHDVLEGRYAATATLQNARSDDAAREWMNNATHMRYSARWLRRVVREIAPFGDRVIAIALDDDQGAYIDNQTWPAPNLRAYLETLRATLAGAMRVATGHAPTIPFFINTYEMKVTASSPVWAMGNWYQSDARQIGEHDRTELGFATGLLQTQPHAPVMVSEFQAGWLAPPDDIRPRAADPSNTTLALHTLLGLGTQGVVDFPMQDTVYPAGMEAPFANAFYAWDAALTLDGARAPRYAPTAAFGALVQRYGSRLARAHRVADAAIAYTTSAFEARALDNDDVFDIAARTQGAQRFCRATGLTCDLVDLRFADAPTLRRYRALIVPMPAFAQRRGLSLVAAAAVNVRAFDAGGGVVLAYPSGVGVRGLRHEWVVRHDLGDEAAAPAANAAATPDPFAGPASTGDQRATASELLRRAGLTPAVAGLSNATLLAAPGDGGAFLDVVNYEPSVLTEPGGTVRGPHGERIAVAPFTVAPRDAVLVEVRSPRGDRAAQPPSAAASAPWPASVPVRDDAPLPAPSYRPVPAGAASAYLADPYRDGSRAVVIDNGRVRAIVAADAGARAFVLEDLARGVNCFDSVGALRDDVLLQIPVSPTDRIAKYTRSFSAGTFNRSYDATVVAGGPPAQAAFRYAAPDVLPAGAVFTRTLTLDPGSDELAVTAQAQFPGDASGRQRALSVTSLAVGASAGGGDWYVIDGSAAQPFAPQTALEIPPSGALGFYDATSGTLATLVWDAASVERATVAQKTFSLVSTLQLAPGTAHLRLACTAAATVDDAVRAVAARRDAAQGR